MLLGQGDYVSRLTAQVYARKAWFKAIDDVTPEVLERFRDDVWVREPQLPRNSAEAYTESLLGLIVSWAEEFYINEEWVRFAGLNTISSWKRDPDTLRWVDWDTGSPDNTLPFSNHNFELTFDAWNPLVETWDSYYKRLKERFDQRAIRYHVIQENYMANYRFRRTARKRARSGPPDLHFRWLALYQCGGKSYRQIADEHVKISVVGEDTVAKAIKQMAERVGIPLRSKRKPTKETDS